MSCYLNRRVIGKIHKLQSLVAPGFVAQTNSRFNGCYLKAIRIYRTVGDKGRPARAIRFARSEQGIDALIDDAETIRAEISPLPSPAAVSAAPDLLAALEPLAALLQPHMDEYQDDRVFFAVNYGRVTIGDLRRARAAIAKAEAVTP